MGVDLYGPGYVSGDSAALAMLRTLGQLIDNLLAGATPALGSVVDASVAEDAAIALPKIAGLVAALAALDAADTAEAAARAAADLAEAAARAAADGTLTTGLAAEISDRAAAIAGEATARAAADGTLTTGLAAETAARAAADSALAAAATLRVANAQTVDYTLVLADAGKAIEVNSATAKSVTVPPNATVAFPLGTLVEVAQAGAGAVSLVAGASVTFEGGVTTPAQGGSLLLRKLGTNNWRVVELAPRGTYVQMIALAGSPDLLITGAITRDDNDAATSAPVTWPDGTPGVYTATSVSTVFPGAVDAYTITYGDPATRTYTQAAVTRNTNGAVTARPAIAVA